jgi:hypothetical protein
MLSKPLSRDEVERLPPTPSAASVTQAGSKTCSAMEPCNEPARCRDTCIRLSQFILQYQ